MHGQTTTGSARAEAAPTNATEEETTIAALTRRVEALEKNTTTGPWLQAGGLVIGGAIGLALVIAIGT
jgi:imidazolonepropionase-like amidohydrolase